jgi:hypothetical protein
MDNKLYINIDVSKEWIDIAIHGTRKVHRLANTEAAMTESVGQLDHSRAGLVCFEPTGGYERCSAVASVGRSCPMSGCIPTRAWLSAALAGSQPCPTLAQHAEAWALLLSWPEALTITTPTAGGTQPEIAYFRSRLNAPEPFTTTCRNPPAIHKFFMKWIIWPVSPGW